MKKSIFWVIWIAIWITALPASLLAADAPEGWVPYKITDSALRCGGYSKNEWEVKLSTEGNLSIASRSSYQRPQTSLPFTIEAEAGVNDGLKGDCHIEKVLDGWLVGFNAGEWGGALWWFSEDGKNRKKLADENVVGLAKTSTHIMAVTGLAHLSMDQGKIFDILQDKVGEWKAVALVDLQSAPQAFIVESPESVLVITTENLVRVKTDGTAKKLYKHRYRLLYSNSMTLSENGVIYVGMRNFVTRLTPTQSGYKDEWFVPKDCQRFELKEYDCVCLGGS